MTIGIKKGREGLAEEGFDSGLALFLSGGIEGAEEAIDFVGFKVEAFDLVVGAAALDGGPVHDGSAARNRVAHV